jgi:TonB family protein
MAHLAQVPGVRRESDRYQQAPCKSDNHVKTTLSLVTPEPVKGVYSTFLSQLPEVQLSPPTSALFSEVHVRSHFCLDFVRWMLLVVTLSCFVWRSSAAEVWSDSFPSQLPVAAFEAGAIGASGLQQAQVMPDSGSGVIVKKVQPVYPPVARQARIQGVVILDATISKNGDVVSLRTVSGHPMLVPSAIEAAKQWKFKPYQFNGKPAEITTQIQVDFALSSDTATDPWSADPFSADPMALRQAADVIPVARHSEVTVLLNDIHFHFDDSARLSTTRHLIYRIETAKAVENWAQVSSYWQPWHQSRPSIRVRVITTDNLAHWLDPRTLNDVPVHQEASDLYTDDREVGGPLPAISAGAIVEEEVIVADTEPPLFNAGTALRWRLGWYVPVFKTHIRIDHPESIPLHYHEHLLPESNITASHDRGVETIVLDQGPLAAYPPDPDHIPSDAVLRPEIEFSNGSSWKLVATEYDRITDEKIRSADVRPLLASINLKDGTRNDVVRRVVAVLHKNVRYTGVEFGESGLIPQFPSETLKRKYGDCKDKATLLVTMLRAAGIPAHLALLVAGPGRDITADLPGIGLFDHAIVYIPASSSDPELWIDATAQFMQVGTLPWMDYGRQALIVSPDTESLTKIPDLTSAQNVHRELRVFTLAEYGKASIVETDDSVGPEEADYRGYYSTDTKEIRKSADQYVRNMYLADSLLSLEHDDLSDLDKPLAIKFVSKGKRGITDLDSAVVGIRWEALYDSLPLYFRTPEDHNDDLKSDDHKKSDQPAEPDDTDKPEARSVDWRITPFTTEWRYEINAPLGFKLRALPSSKKEKVDVLDFSQEYSSNPEGNVVKAVLRVECSTSRLTVGQAKALRDAVIKARNADPLLITFDQIGQALIAAGQIKEGLAAYRQIASQHPKEALHMVQLARALISVGLGEESRVAAQQATSLEPNSGLAFRTLGGVLRNDRIGRPLEKGMDYNGAVAAYRKAIELDPNDKDSRAELAVLLEYDVDGIRYSEKANLKDAAAQLRALKKLDEEFARSYDDNLLYDLWYAHDYLGVLDAAASLPTNDVRKGLTVAAVAAQQGTDAALKKSVEITTGEQNRSQILLNAGAVLVRVRKYPEGSAMFAEAARGQSNGSQIARSAAIFANARPYSDLKIGSNDPRAVVQEMFASILDGTLSFEHAKTLVYIDPRNPDANDEKGFNEMMSSARAEFKNTGLPRAILADLTLSNMHYAVEGDDSLGYRITLEAPGSAAKDIFVLRYENRYKIASFSASENTSPDDLASVALLELDKNNLAAARKWLDRAREQIHISSGDDPLAGAIFPNFWTKGQEADAATIRLAALTLLPAKQMKQPEISTVMAARDNAKTPLERARLNLVLAHAYSVQEKFADLLPVALDLSKAYPDSLFAFDLVTAGYMGTKHFDDWDALLQSRIHDHPDEVAYQRSAVRLANAHSQFARAREIGKTLIDKGQAKASDLNDYAWYALALPGPIDQDTIDKAVRANDLNKDSFNLQHTLGCIYAQAGKTTEARELLLKAMETSHLEEPNSEVWFGFALIAEQYGVTDAAARMFARVEKPNMDYPGSTYALAQQHMVALRYPSTGNPAQ